MPKNIDLEEEKRNELGKQMVEDLLIIMELEQIPIKHFKANKNGIFYEVHDARRDNSLKILR